VGCADEPTPTPTLTPTPPVPTPTLTPTPVEDPQPTAAPSVEELYLDVAEWFKPHLLMHEEELHKPDLVEVMVGADTRMCSIDSGVGCFIVNGQNQDHLFEQRETPGLYLDIPFNAILADPYHERYQRTWESEPPITYVRVIDSLAATRGVIIQYWFFYYFQDFVANHEGDWELIQLNFPEGKGIVEIWESLQTDDSADDVEPDSAVYSAHGIGWRSPL